MTIPDDLIEQAAQAMRADAHWDLPHWQCLRQARAALDVVARRNGKPTLQDKALGWLEVGS